MTQYIDKDALVAEIGRRKEINKYRDTPDGLFEDEAILSFINTLEVKEVDLEEVLKEYFKGWEVNEDLGLVKPDGWSCIVKDLYTVAKHFFELGLKAQQNISINVTDIDKVIEENGVDPNSKEAKIFKESYYIALEKFKA